MITIRIRLPAADRSSRETWPNTRTSLDMTDQERIHSVIRSNDELRAVLILAGKELAKRKMVGKRYKALLNAMRRSVREVRAAQA
jgi:hypothetical protein